MAGGCLRLTQNQKNRLAILQAEGSNPSYSFMAAMQQIEQYCGQSENDAWQVGSFAFIYADPVTGSAGTSGVLQQCFNGKVISTHVTLIDGDGSVRLAISRNNTTFLEHNIPTQETDQIERWYTPNGKRVIDIIDNPPAVH